MALALGGIFLAWAIYYREWVSSRSLRNGFGPLTALFENKYYLDRIYEDFFVTRIFQQGWNRLVEANDRFVVDGAVNGGARAARELSARLRVIQNGQLQGYGLGFAAGVIVLVITVFAVNPL
jgi:NADH-quinone oxidoreductase subunit L